MKEFDIQKAGNDAGALPLPDYVNVKRFAAATNENETVPAGAYFAIFSADVDFYVKRGGTAAVPSDDVSDGSGSFLNPLIVSVIPGDVIGVIAIGSGTVTIAYYGNIT